MASCPSFRVGWPQFLHAVGWRWRLDDAISPPAASSALPWRVSLCTYWARRRSARRLLARLLADRPLQPRQQIVQIEGFGEEVIRADPGRFRCEVG
jgi:hypothetical protein